MKTSATAKFVGTSARKTGLVAALIRGRGALEAQTILQNTNKRATTPVGKVLASAIANAENNYNAKATSLIVESIFIGPGPTLKRSMPRAKGSSSAIRKRSSHITVVLTDGRTLAEKASAKPTGGTKALASEQAGAGTDTGTTDDKGSVRRREEGNAEVTGPVDVKETKQEEAK
jgi:large subunit ribosomal protein L22